MKNTKMRISFREFLKQKGLIEDKTKPRLNPYEQFVQNKMDAWKIKSLEELEPEPYKRFWKEVDAEWVSKDEKEKKEHNSHKKHRYAFGVVF